jgi:hypothetical protein
MKRYRESEEGKMQNWKVTMFLYNGKTIEYETKAISNDFAQNKAFKHFGLTWKEVKSAIISPN